MTLELLPNAAPSFDAPLELLRACHARITARCHTLRKLQAHLPQHGCDTPARQAAASVLRYFETAAQHHHEDEEIDLFPLLMADAKAQHLIDKLVAEHRTLESHWRALHPELLAIHEGRNSILASADAFIAAYERHIEQENGQLLPLAAKLLDSQQLATLGQRMKIRRHATSSSLESGIL